MAPLDSLGTVLDINHLANLPALPYRQFQCSEFFRVVVGPEVTEYHLHKETLISHCPYFAGLHSFGGVETTENTVTLPDISVRAFKVFITFIYGNVYHLPTDLSCDETFIVHAEVYILGDRMCMTDLRTQAFEGVKKAAQDCGYKIGTMVKVVEHIFDNTPDKDTEGEKLETESGNTHAMRKLLVKLCCYHLKPLMKCASMALVVRSHGELAVDMLSRLNGLDSIDYDGD